jgi:CRISPR-associated endonuclease/helicase Cas3
MAEIDFTAFYEAAHGHSPFPWQVRLARLAVSGEWPTAISIPTGCGKTSVIDAAVYALAQQAGKPRRAAPMRIFFVVDRRLVVDDVHAHAERLAKAIEENENLRVVREQLLRFKGAVPLAVAVLRGGMYRNNTWADAPNQPLVCVSTVDQIGSRLLFRGYGVNDRQRPVHAGLIGNDSLLIVDEAHLSQPFLDTLAWVQRYQSDGWREETPIPGLKAVRMSATIGGGFQLESTDLGDERLRRRLDASKTAELKQVTDLAKAAAEEANRLSSEGPEVVGVVLNTVGAARACFSLLSGEKILLTGRVRPSDRDKLLQKYQGRIKAGRAAGAGKLFVVATQTVEVGADLDFDALVTEAAPMDALRQRFGRLDRLGRRGQSNAVILKPKKQLDWVYGDATERAWVWLTAQGATVDFGIRALPEWPEDASTERSRGPVVLPAYVDAWAQTNPTPAWDPDVAPFLHGAQAQPADVQLVWRADLDSDDDPRLWAAVIEAAPPLSTEALAISLRAAKGWLAGKVEPIADVEGAGAASEEESRRGTRKFLVWRGPEEKPATLLRSIRPGDTIIVASDEGGCDEYGWNPDSTVPVRDIGDECANQRAHLGGGRFRLRIHPKVLFPAHDQREKRDELSTLLNRLADGDDDALGAMESLIGETGARYQWNRARTYGAGNAVLIEAPRRAMKSVADSEEPDALDEPSLTKRMSLEDHTNGVVEKAETFAAACGLGDVVAAAIKAAAGRHDLGKADHRFQMLLGNWCDPPAAKGDGCSLAEHRRRGRDSGYPQGARHEFASAALAVERGDWLPGCDSALAQFLIGTHHGFGRPIPPVWKDESVIEAVVDGRRVRVSNVARFGRIDSGWVDLYWRMTRRYGWWGLAYLEAVVRRADCVRSREEENQ